MFRNVENIAKDLHALASSVDMADQSVHSEPFLSREIEGLKRVWKEKFSNYSVRESGYNLTGNQGLSQA